MIWVFVISFIMIVTGAAFSILRNPQTLDYCKTIVSDGRKDDYARTFVARYKAGLAVMLAGVVLLITASIYVLMR